jgi:hypothetical protein
MQRLSQQPNEVKVPFANTVVGSMCIAVEGLNQGNGELGDSFGRIGWDVCDKETEALGGREVDIVVARATEEDGSDAGVVECSITAALRVSLTNTQTA